MGTWICHLRIAEQLLPHFPELDRVTFTYGNLAPDSGIPNETWTKFDPPKEVTHFMEKGEGEEMIRDLDYYREFVAGLNSGDDIQKYSFRLGFFTHLICDILWAKYLLQPTMELAKDLLAQDELKAWDAIKEDWYGLDQRYNRTHPEGLFWRVIYRTPSPPSYLPFINEKALHQQYSHIRKFYSEPDAGWFVERPFPYLNEPSMVRVVTDTTQAALLILDKIKYTTLHGQRSSFELLPAELLFPYTAPL